MLRTIDLRGRTLSPSELLATVPRAAAAREEALATAAHIVDDVAERGEAALREQAERFDGVFFLDLPGRAEKDAIWEIYRDEFQIDHSQRLPEDTNWTGAEIRSCCRLAALLDLPLVQAAQNIVPVAVTAAESVDRLRNWASGRCLSADRPGIYQRESSGTSSPPASRRRVSRDPSNN